MVLALVLVSCILLFLAAVGWPAIPQVSIGWLGLFFFVLSTVWGRVG